MRGWIVAGLVVLAVSAAGVRTLSGTTGTAATTIAMTDAMAEAPGVDEHDATDAPDALARAHRRHLRERAAAEAASTASAVESAPGAL